MFRKKAAPDNQLRWISLIFLFVSLIIIGRLFWLQIMQHNYYSLFALNSHEIYETLHPHRGTIYVQDANKQEYPVAVNKQFFQVYAVPKEFDPGTASSTAARLIELLGVTDEAKKTRLFTRFGKQNDVYEAVQRKVPEEVVTAIKAAGLKGVYATPEEFRFYPEQNLGAPVFGFCSLNDVGNGVGKYGLEAYWDDKLAGTPGFRVGERGAFGSWITMAGMTLNPSQNGADMLLTIDRTLQYTACKRLQEGLAEFGAKRAALVMMDPKTGAVLAMCSLPDFDPNNYSTTPDIDAFNNQAIFTAYEPGSVFKPITMAIALSAGLVAPDTTFTDPCFRMIDGFPRPIYNALKKCYGLVTMTQVLENSINTGMIWVEEKMGRSVFQAGVAKFGFGQKTGITLSTETAGDVSSLDKKNSPIYGATGSFGQGLTVTPIQLAVAYSALVNNGKLPVPYIVQEVRYPDGHKDKTTPRVADTVISERAAGQIRAMLVSVIENGKSYVKTKLPDYYMGGKTGTAQVPGKGGYTEDTNHTFVGFATAKDPRFVLVIKYEKPDRRWAESTAAPVFKDIMHFALQYYGIAPER
jgi:cell division protein FtsI/penicillin-binding protein 2